MEVGAACAAAGAAGLHLAGAATKSFTLKRHAFLVKDLEFLTAT